MKKRYEIENENGLTKNEIIKFFYENENTIKDKDCTWIYKANLVQINLWLKNGTKLIFGYSDRLDFIDLTLYDGGFIGLGSNLVSPFSDIVKMVVDFR